MSIDRREDAGDFYQGGKVISTRPVATGGDVKHSDFAGLGVKTNTIPDLREAVRELGRRLGATVVTALAACVAVAATVQTVPVNGLDFDANPSIVTNVVFDAPPDFSTNNTELVETIEATAPAPGDYAAVSNAAVYAAITNALQDAKLANKLDNSGGVLYGSLYFSGVDNDKWDFLNLDNIGEHPGRMTIGYDTYSRWFLFRSYDSLYNWATVKLPADRDGTVALTSDIAGKQDNLPYPTNAIPYAAISGKPTNVSAFNNDAGYLTGYTESDPTVSSWAKQPTKPTYTAAEVGATTPEDVTAAIREQSLGGIWDETLQVWWTPRMRNGSLTYEATTNVNLNAEN